MRVAVLSVHTSPLAQPGNGDAGGLNVYVLQSALHLARRGVAVDIFTCGGLDPRKGFAWLERVLGASDARMQEVVRGIPEHVAEATPLLPSDVTVLGHGVRWERS